MQLLKLTKSSDGLSFWVNADHIATMYNSSANPNGCTLTMANGNAHQVKESVGRIAEFIGGAVCVADDDPPAAPAAPADPHS